MQPVKSIIPLAKTFLRFTVLLFAAVTYFDVFRQFHIRSADWLISVFFLVFALLLFVGEFARSATWSIISGLVVFGLSVYELVRGFHGMIDTRICLFLFTAAIGLYFVGRGNKG